MHDLWILLALMAAIATAAGTIFLKLADKTKYHNNIILAFTFLFMGIFSFLYLLYERKLTYNTLSNCDKNFLMIIILYALFIILEFKLMITAMKYTPNIGYTRTLMNLNIIITLFISYFIFKEKINKECFFGILLCIIGVSIIAQYYKKE